MMPPGAPFQILDCQMSVAQQATNCGVGLLMMVVLVVVILALNHWRQNGK
jgi:hypothetical protein